jgi:hypothetical protein
MILFRHIFCILASWTPVRPGFTLNKRDMKNNGGTKRYNNHLVATKPSSDCGNKSISQLTLSVTKLLTLCVLQTDVIQIILIPCNISLIAPLKYCVAVETSQHKDNLRCPVIMIRNAKYNIFIVCILLRVLKLKKVLRPEIRLTVKRNNVFID